VRAPAAIVALALAGCASWGTVSAFVARADHLAVAGDLEGALRAYDAALAHGANGEAGMRARAGRASTAAALAARDEMRKVREELALRERELERLRADVAARTAEAQRLTRDLSTRDGELSRVKQDLTARQAELVRLATEAEELRSSIEDLKRLEIRLERRPR
jgi:chromosome segregation ATPase